MATIRCIAALGLAAPVLFLSVSHPAPAADPEVSKEVIAVQLRKQGFECKNPESAERDTEDSKPDENAWLLTCEGVRYKVKLIPKMAAKVEKLPEEEESENKEGASPSPNGALPGPIPELELDPRKR